VASKRAGNKEQALKLLKKVKLLEAEIQKLQAQLGELEAKKQPSSGDLDANTVA